jgi:hypothetical protein
VLLLLFGLLLFGLLLFELFCDMRLDGDISRLAALELDSVDDETTSSAIKPGP